MTEDSSLTSIDAINKDIAKIQQQLRLLEEQLKLLVEAKAVLERRRIPHTSVARRPRGRPTVGPMSQKDMAVQEVVRSQGLRMSEIFQQVKSREDFKTSSSKPEKGIEQAVYRAMNEELLERVNSVYLPTEKAKELYQ